MEISSILLDLDLMLKIFIIRGYTYMAEYLREFQMETKFRLIAQSTIQPFITRLEQQILETLKKQEKLDYFNNQMSKLISNSKLLMETIQYNRQQLKLISLKNTELDQNLSLIKAENESMKTNFNQKTDSLERELVTRTNQVNKYEQVTQKLQNLKTETNNSTTKIQDKISEVLEICLDDIQKLKITNQKSFSKQMELQFIIGELKQANINNFQNAELFLSERDQNKQRLALLQNKVTTFASSEDLQQFKKFQIIQLQSTSQRLSRFLNSVLSAKVTQQLPSMSRISQDIQYIKQQQKRIEKDLKQAFEDFVISIKGQMEFQEKRISQLIDSQLQIVINKRSRQIYHVVMGMIPQDEKEIYAQLKKQIPLIHQVKQKLQNISKIQETNNKLHQQIANLSNTINQLSSRTLSNCAVIQGNVKILHQKFHKTEEKHIVAGKVLSSFLQILNILVANSITSSQQSINSSEKQIFKTVNDGMIFQIRNLPLGLVLYREKVYKTYDLLRCSMHALNRLSDDGFKQQSLGWSSNKPLSIFKSFGISSVKAEDISKMNLMQQKRSRVTTQIYKNRSSFKRTSTFQKSQNLSISFDHLDIIKSGKRQKNQPNNRIEQFTSKTSRIRSRNMVRKHPY